MWRITFLPFFISIALLEGLGVPNGREVAFYLILVMPVFLILADLIDKRTTLYPAKLTLLFMVFLILTAISSFFSLDFSRSFPQLLFYLALFLIFLWTYNHQDELKGMIIFLIFSLSVIFSIYSLLPLIWPSLIPSHGYQFIFSNFGSHNHLGDFLLLPLIISFYKSIQTKQRIYLLGLIFLPFFLLSFSRSAYSALIVTLSVLIVYLFRIRKIKMGSLVVGAVLIILALFFFLTSVWEARQIPLLKGAHQFLEENANLQDKFFLANRLAFARQAVLSFKEAPYFGVGPNNFVYASQKYTQTGRWAYSSHNIFLDILAENGLLAAITFMGIIGLVLIKAFIRPTIYSFLFLAMLINFQTDYTHTIYSFMLLFFILMGLQFKENEIFRSHLPVVLSFLVLILASLWAIFF